MLEVVVQLSDKPLIWCGDLNVRLAFFFFFFHLSFFCGEWEVVIAPLSIVCLLFSFKFLCFDYHLLAQRSGY